MVRCFYEQIDVDPSLKSRYDIDWLSFVVKFPSDLEQGLKEACSIDRNSPVYQSFFAEQVRELCDPIFKGIHVPFDDFVLQRKGLNRYSEWYDYKASGSCIFLTCANRPDMGVYFSLSSDFIHWLGEDRLFLLMAYIKTHDNIKPSRVDVLFDDFDNKSFDYDDFNAAVIEHCFGRPTWLSTRCSTIELYSECVNDIPYKNKQSCDFRDTNITIGRRSSNTYCRIYNKMIEQISKNRSDYDGTNGDPKPIHFWKRIELELKHDHAVEFFENFTSFDQVPSLFCHYFEKHVQVRKKEVDDPNVFADWWVKFVELSKTIYFVQLPKVLTIPSGVDLRWQRLVKQYAGFLLAAQHYDFDLKRLRYELMKIPFKPRDFDYWLNLLNSE